MTTMTFAVFGLGEAGGAIAADLAAQGVSVRGYDPAPVVTPEGVVRFDDAPEVAVGAQVVLAVTAAKDAMAAAEQALERIETETLYLDLATSAPAAKRELADLMRDRGVRFADVALMSTVPGKGIGTPALVSGAAAVEAAELLGGFGMPIEVAGDEAGVAATRKLLRSVMVKGLAAVVIESMKAARAAGLTDETWTNIVDQLIVTDEAFVRRLVDGTSIHAERRRDEMAAAVELLNELGVESVMAQATVTNLDSVLRDGLDPLPPPT